MSEKRICLQCDNGTLLFSGWHCPMCGECEFDDGEGKRYSAAMDAFAASVDSELAASLRVFRKKLGLKQAEAGRLFGGGVNAFSEYERDKTRPPRATVLLLRLLDRHPELLAEIR